MKRDGAVIALVIGGAAYLLYRMTQGGNSGVSYGISAITDSGTYAAGFPAIAPITTFGDSIGMASIQDWATAIAKVESGGNPDALSYRNNNPGNLTPIRGGWSGQVGTNGPFAVFDSLQSGWNALYADLQHNVNANPNWTLTNFFAHYLGNPDPLHPQVTDQGNPFTYAQSVAGQLGVSPDATLGSLFGA